MPAHTQILYHLVFTPIHRRPVLLEPDREQLYAYIVGIINNLKSHPYRIGGVEDHIHILTSLHPSLSLANLVQQIKVSSHKWIVSNSIFPGFTSWQDRYFAATVDFRRKEQLIHYITHQKEHHGKVDFEQEYRLLLQEFGVEINEKYFWR